MNECCHRWKLEYTVKVYQCSRCGSYRKIKLPENLKGGKNVQRKTKT